MKARINEIFPSIDGEANYFHQGRTSVFIRFAGCNCKCVYCDAVKAQTYSGARIMTTEEIYQDVDRHGIRKVTMTGGEPLLQEDALRELCSKFAANGYMVTIETNGTKMVDTFLLARAAIVMDYKLPFTGEEKRMRIPHFLALRGIDMVKFVVAELEDFHHALKIKNKLEVYGLKARVVFSPMWDSPAVKNLHMWMIDTRINAICSYQIHKFIGAR